MTKKNGVNYSLQENMKSRRRNVINRLESQLKSGWKTCGPKSQFSDPLTDSDRNRINKEIDILKTRI